MTSKYYMKETKWKWYLTGKKSIRHQTTIKIVVFWKVKIKVVNHHRALNLLHKEMEMIK
jgi:hypothetical protein